MSVTDMGDHIEKGMIKDLMSLPSELDDTELQIISDGVWAATNMGKDAKAIGYFLGVAISAIKEGYTAEYAVELALMGRCVSDSKGCQ